MHPFSNVPEQIALFTDFGVTGPYVGQMKSVILAGGVHQPVYELMSDAPAFNARASAYLLPALIEYLPLPSLLVCVVDPGVGSDRLPLLVEAGGHLLIGPDNGLMSQVILRATDPKVYQIDWRPEKLSNSFHGRDLFAPVAARLAAGHSVKMSLIESGQLKGHDWPAELAEIIYIDGYGNAMTGLRVSASWSPEIVCSGRLIRQARTFSDVPKGQAFFYQNAYGLLEISVNQGNAADQLGIAIGDSIAFR